MLILTNTPMRRAKRILMIAMVAPLLVTLFAYGAVLQPIRLGPLGAIRTCYEGEPIIVRIELYDRYLPIPFAQIKLYDNGVLIASARAGPRGECSPIYGVKPGTYLMIATGASQMFVDYIDIHDVSGMWKKQYFISDDSFERVINYGLFPGRLDIDGFVVEVPPLTAVHITRQAVYRFEEGWLSLKLLLEPFRDIIWNPIYAIRVLPSYIIMSSFPAVIGLIILSKRRNLYIALALVLMFMIEARPVFAQPVTYILSVYTDWCWTCIIYNVNEYPLVVDVEETVPAIDHYAASRIVVTLFDIQTNGGDYVAKARLTAWPTLAEGAHTVGVNIVGVRYDHTEILSLGDTIRAWEQPYDYTHTITLPTTNIDHYRLTISFHGTGSTLEPTTSFMNVYFRITPHPFATNKTAVSLVTKYSFNTGFGQDNPIDYRGPALPPGVEQAITGTEMLVESMFVRQYSVHLLPDWAIRGEISRGLVGWVHMEPRNVFGLPVPGQEWVEPPSADVNSPNEVVFRGKIRSRYNYFFNQRIPFPFAPYYEFPTIFEIPLDHGRTGGSTVSGLDYATCLL